MMWLTLVVIAVVIAWLASSAVRKQKLMTGGGMSQGRDPQHGKEVGRE